MTHGHEVGFTTTQNLRRYSPNAPAPRDNLGRSYVHHLRFATCGDRFLQAVGPQGLPSWLKPLFVSIYRGAIILGFLGGAKWISRPSTVLAKKHKNQGGSWVHEPKDTHATGLTFLWLSGRRRSRQH